MYEWLQFSYKNTHCKNTYEVNIPWQMRMINIENYMLNHREAVTTPILKEY